MFLISTTQIDLPLYNVSCSCLCKICYILLLISSLFSYKFSQLTYIPNNFIFYIRALFRKRNPQDPDSMKRTAVKNWPPPEVVRKKLYLKLGLYFQVNKTNILHYKAVLIYLKYRNLDSSMNKHLVQSEILQHLNA